MNIGCWLKGHRGSGMTEEQKATAIEQARAYRWHAYDNPRGDPGPCQCYQTECLRCGEEYKEMCFGCRYPNAVYL